jgi:hypothetical protein
MVTVAVLRQIAIFTPRYCDDTEYAYHIRLMQAAIKADRDSRDGLRRFDLDGEFMKETSNGDFVRYDDLSGDSDALTPVL